MTGQITKKYARIQEALILLFLVPVLLLQPMPVRAESLTAPNTYTTEAAVSSPILQKGAWFSDAGNSETAAQETEEELQLAKENKSSIGKKVQEALAYLFRSALDGIHWVVQQVLGSNIEDIILQRDMTGYQLFSYQFVTGNLYATISAYFYMLMRRIAAGFLLVKMTWALVAVAINEGLTGRSRQGLKEMATDSVLYMLLLVLTPNFVNTLIVLRNGVTRAVVGMFYGGGAGTGILAAFRQVAEEGLFGCFLYAAMITYTFLLAGRYVRMCMVLLAYVSYFPLNIVLSNTKQRVAAWWEGVLAEIMTPLIDAGFLLVPVALCAVVEGVTFLNKLPILVVIVMWCWYQQVFYMSVRRSLSLGSSLSDAVGRTLLGAAVGAAARGIGRVGGKQKGGDLTTLERAAESADQAEQESSFADAEEETKRQSSRMLDGLKNRFFEDGTDTGDWETEKQKEMRADSVLGDYGKPKEEKMAGFGMPGVGADGTPGADKMATEAENAERDATAAMRAENMQSMLQPEDDGQLDVEPSGVTADELLGRENQDGQEQASRAAQMDLDEGAVDSSGTAATTGVAESAVGQSEGINPDALTAYTPEMGAQIPNSTRKPGTLEEAQVALEQKAAERKQQINGLSQAVATVDEKTAAVKAEQKQLELDSTARQNELNSRIAEANQRAAEAGSPEEKQMYLAKAAGYRTDLAHAREATDAKMSELRADEQNLQSQRGMLQNQIGTVRAEVSSIEAARSDVISQRRAEAAAGGRRFVQDPREAIQAQKMDAIQARYATLSNFTTPEIWKSMSHAQKQKMLELNAKQLEIQAHRERRANIAGTAAAVAGGVAGGMMGMMYGPGGSVAGGAVIGSVTRKGAEKVASFTVHGKEKALKQQFAAEYETPAAEQELQASIRQDMTYYADADTNGRGGASWDISYVSPDPSTVGYRYREMREDNPVIQMDEELAERVRTVFHREERGVDEAPVIQMREVLKRQGIRAGDAKRIEYLQEMAAETRIRVERAEKERSSTVRTVAVELPDVVDSTALTQAAIRYYVSDAGKEHVTTVFNTGHNVGKRSAEEYITTTVVFDSLVSNELSYLRQQRGVDVQMQKDGFRINGITYENGSTFLTGLLEVGYRDDFVRHIKAALPGIKEDQIEDLLDELAALYGTGQEK